jgi:AraC family transcriptional regulator, regulatory protein of adaptative response / methylated-DNA-[protein]-cysteine methyltransferase
MNASPHIQSMSFEKSSSVDYARIETAIGQILTERDTPPSLEDLASRAGLSPFHFQRVFKRWAGVSPKQFARYLSVTYAKEALERSVPILDAALNTGLSGPSRLHDLFVSIEAMTPGEYKAQGRALVIRYGVVDVPFGRTLFLMTKRGVCGVDFTDGHDAAALERAKRNWPLSRFEPDDVAARDMAERIFGMTSQRDPNRSTPLLLRGTNFQLQVWSALLRVPEGGAASYGDIAKAIGKPKASRAVGAALAANTLAYVIPCHRVLRATGLFKSYRWGTARRWAMLGWEAARCSASCDKQTENNGSRLSRFR